MASFLWTSLIFVACTSIIAALIMSNFLIDNNVQITASAEIGNTGSHAKIGMDCQVLIIGSGFAGSFAAYELAPRYTDGLCLVEKLDRDGGRIHDISEYPNGPVFGVGPLRITEEQPAMIALAEQLGITLQTETEVELIKVRGRYFYRDRSNRKSETTKMCKDIFHEVACSTNDSIPTDKLMFQILLNLKQESPHIIHSHPDFPTLLLKLFGDEGLAFLRECGRYFTPFTSVSTHGMVDYFEHEQRNPLGQDPYRLYPEGGMSQYIKRMIDSATNNGMRMHRNEPVEKMSTTADGRFHVETRSYSITTTNVLCSIDPLGFQNVQGNVAERVKSAPEFMNIAPKSLATVTAWWNERWWESSVEFRNLSRIVSHANCFNIMEIPTFEYGREQNVTRAVYDDGSCVGIWRTLIAKGDTERLANEVVNSLQHFFVNLTVPRPRYLKGYVHENAWHFQHPQSDTTNEQVFQWALRPLAQRNFALIGEAYNLNFAGWCDGALKSTMEALTRFYNHTSPIATTQ